MAEILALVSKPPKIQVISSKNYDIKNQKDIEIITI